MGTLLWETLPEIHYSFGNRSSIHCSREINGNFLVAEPRSPTKVIPKPRSGKNHEMFLTISKHYETSYVDIKVPLLSLFGVQSVRAERSSTTKIVHDFLISVSTRPVCLSPPDIFHCLLIPSFCSMLFLCVKDSVTRKLWLRIPTFNFYKQCYDLCLSRLIVIRNFHQTGS